MKRNDRSFGFLKFSTIRVLCVLAAIFLSASACPGAVRARAGETRTVIMGYFEYANMCRGASEGAEKSGYVYDYMQKISSYTGWGYEYRYGTYAELYELLKNGGIDVLPYTNWNEQRAGEVLFSEEPILEEQYFLAAGAGSSLSGAGPAALNGGRIGTVTGADQNALLLAYLETNGVDAEIVYFEDPELSWDALEQGRLDAAVFSNISYRENADWDVLDSFGSKPTYIAVSKGNERLLEELDEAMGTLLQTNPIFVSELQAAVYAGNPAMTRLSEREKEWLGGRDGIRVGCLENGSIVYARRNEDGTVSGLAAELLEKFFADMKIGLTVEYRSFATPEELGDALIRGDVDVAYPFFPSFLYAERDGLSISNTLTVNTMAAVYRNDTPPSGAMKRIAVDASALSKYYLANRYPDCEVIAAASGEEAVRLLRNGTVSGVVCEAGEAVRFVQRYRNLEETVLDIGCETCFAASLENSPLIVLLNRGISSLQKSEITALAAGSTIQKSISFSDYLGARPELIILLALIPVFIIGLLLALSATTRLRRKAQAASEAKTKFLFNMSHDIRTPMNAILGYTDIAIRHRDDGERVYDSLKKIRTSGGHLLNLINDILEMSRIESGKLELAENPMDIRETVASVDQMGQALAVPKSITFRTVVGRIDDPFVLADELHISEVMINLVSNAVKYTGDSGTVTVRAEQTGAAQDGRVQMRFSVEDNGIGMSEEFQQHLFESFSRENSAAVSTQEGAGLGLAIVKRITDLAGGTIEVHSRQGEGSVFTVLLPMKVMDRAAVEEFLENRRPVDAEYRLEGRRALLVEDNEMNREIAAELLEEEGLLIDTAEDGQKSLELLESRGILSYDFILMDIQMPVMDGYTATKEIRRRWPDAHVPIIALSANAFAEDRAASAAAGMDDHVAKPIDTKELFSVLARFN